MGASDLRARRKDANHTEVGDFLRERGFSVLDLAQHGISCDYAVSCPGFAALLEVKDGTKPPSARKLTPEEERLKANWQGPYVLALDPVDAYSRLMAEKYLAHKTLCGAFDQ